MKNTRFQHRLDCIAGAVVQRDINDWAWELKLTTSSKLYSEVELTYTFKKNGESGCFIGTTDDDAIVSCLMHSGSNENEGGYGGGEFVLIMKDESIRSVRGPWSGRPSVHRLFGAPEYLVARVENKFGIGVLEGLSWDFVNAILAKFDLPFTAKVMEFVSNESCLQLVPKETSAVCEHPNMEKFSYEWELPSGGDEPGASGITLDFSCPDCGYESSEEL